MPDPSTGANLNLDLDLVKAAEAIVSAAAAAVEAAERSCVIEVDNLLSVPLTLHTVDHDSGGFGTKLPAGVIPPMGFDVFNSRSSGVATGAIGQVIYRFRDREFAVFWSNPFLGGNESRCDVRPPDDRFRVINITGNGNRGAHMRFIIADVTQLPQTKREVRPHSGNFIQSKFGRVGNYELVVPREAGGLAFFFRDNDAPDVPWRGPFPFGESAGRVEAVSLIQTSISAAGNGPGNLDVVARIGNRLALFFRADTPGARFEGPFFFAEGV